jgi:hypothetical protein
VQLVDDPVLDSVGARVAVGSGVGARVGDGVGTAAGNGVGTGVGDGVGTAVGNGAGARVGDCVGACVGATENGRTQAFLPLLGTKPVGHSQHTGIPFGP